MTVPVGDQTYKLNRIAEVVAQSNGLSIEELKSKSRRQHIADSRFKAFYLSKKFTCASLNEIGIFFGGLNHSTVFHGLNRSEELRQVDATFRKDLLALQNFFEKEFLA